MAGTAAKARLFSIGYGVVYVLVTILGFMSATAGLLLSSIPINTADNLCTSSIAVPASPSGWRARPAGSRDRAVAA